MHNLSSNNVNNAENQKENNIDSIIENSIKEVTSHDVSFKSSILQASVLSKVIGNVNFSYEHVKKSISSFLHKNTKEVLSKSIPEYVPNHILALEKESISIMKRGKDIFKSMIPHEQAQRIIDELHGKSIAAGGKGINAGQREAIDLMLTSQDRIYAWQGVAGSGKSFSLGAGGKTTMENGLVIKGFAPSAEAAKNLATEAKLSETQTVASLLVGETKPGRAKGKEIWVVDEAGLLSASDAHALLKKAEIEDARVLLVGDTRQLSSVGAGNPFKQLQAYGMKTSQLSQTVRQIDETMKQSVNLIAQGEHQKGLEILDKSGKVLEVKNTDDITSKMANDYLSLTKDELKMSLFISSTNHEKEEITNIVRAELKSKRELHSAMNTVAYVSLDYNEHALKYSHVYSVGDIVVLNRRSQGLTANISYKVFEINHKKNSVTLVNNEDNHFKKEINVSKIKCNLFREEKIELCVGDNVKWTRNHVPAKVLHNEMSSEKREKRLNGQYLTVKELDVKNNKGIFEYENGRLEIVDLSKNQFLDYSYVSTVFSSQGKTCDKVYASLTNVDRENFYVAISRARYDCKIYSKDKEKLYQKVEKFGANITAHEKIVETKTKMPELILTTMNDVSKKLNHSPSLPVQNKQVIKRRLKM